MLFRIIGRNNSFMLLFFHNFILFCPDHFRFVTFLNPARKARRNIFLTDEQWENERKALVNRLSVWLKLLRENDTAEQMRDKAKETAENAENLLNHNLKNALARTRELESAYRTIAFFYKNTESDKVKNVTIVNATMEQLQDLDNTIFADHISNELKQNFDRLDLRRNYSLLVVPGYIGSNAILDKWSKICLLYTSPSPRDRG